MKTEHAGLIYTPIKEVDLSALENEIAYNFKWTDSSRGYDVAFGLYIKERSERIESVCTDNLSSH